MNYAFMTFSTPEQTLDEVLAMAQRYGYAGVEPRVSPSQKHGIDASLTADQRRAVREQFEASGIAMCCLATSCKYADPATLDEQLAETRDFIDLAGDLDCPRLRVFGGKLGDGLTRTDAIKQVADALKGVADQAADRGVTLCLETHDDWTEPADVAAVMEQVAHPNIAVNWDVMHPVRQSGRTMDEAYATLKPWVRHVHVHDGVNSQQQLKLMPIGEGDFDHKRVLELLHADGYDGYISGEWINWEAPEVHLPRELQALRSYERELS